VNKFLILFPSEYKDIFEFFPLLFSIKENYPESEINILVEENDDHIALLPFQVKTYLIKEDDISLIMAGKLAHNFSDIFNITHYVNLRETIASAYLGRTFRAKYRIGYSDFKTKLFYTHTIANDVCHYDDEKHLRPWSNFLDQDLSEYSIMDGSTSENYFLFVLDSCKQDTSFYMLLEKIIKEFSEEAIFLWAGGDDKDHQSLIADFPNLKEISQLSKSELAIHASKARGVITNVGWLARYSCLKDINHIFMVENEREIKHLKHFTSPLNLLKVNESGPSYYMGNDFEENINHPEEAVDLVLRYFKV
jgi:hypothetical protein